MPGYQTVQINSKKPLKPVVVSLPYFMPASHHRVWNWTAQPQSARRASGAASGAASVPRQGPRRRRSRRLATGTSLRQVVPAAERAAARGSWACRSTFAATAISAAAVARLRFVLPPAAAATLAGAAPWAAYRTPHPWPTSPAGRSRPGTRRASSRRARRAAQTDTCAAGPASPRGGTCCRRSCPSTAPAGAPGPRRGGTGRVAGGR